MDEVIGQLAARIWGNPAFQRGWEDINASWLQRQLEVPESAKLSDLEFTRCVQAATILAATDSAEFQRAAYSIAACSYDLVGDKLPGLAGALHMVLTRMGNFPALKTSAQVANFPNLPWSIALDEEVREEENSVSRDGISLVLSDFQRSLWTKLLAGRNVAISAPTSAGKSFLLQSYLRSLAAAGRLNTACYLVPTRALIAQVTEAVTTWRAKDHVSQFDIVNVPLTDEVELPKKAIYVVTQERLLAIMSAHPNFAPEVIICDEAQGISDGARGVLLHNVIDALVARSPNAQLIFAGPNIKNLEVFGQLFNLDHLDELHSRSPSVLQNMIVVNTRSPIKGKVVLQRLTFPERVTLGTVDVSRSLPSIKERLIRISERFGHAKPSIVYANGPSDAEEIALGLSQVYADFQPSEQLQELVDFVKFAVHPGYDLAKCLPRGIGFHYGRIPTLVRRSVEDAFATGDIRYLVTTSTLIQGVNFPAANLFICNPKKGNVNPLDRGDFWNLAGRAGRLGKEFQGNVFLIDYDEWPTAPASEGSEVEIQPYLQNALTDGFGDLLACAEEMSPTGDADGLQNTEAAFSRLLADHMTGKLASTLARCGFPAEKTSTLAEALDRARSRISLPANVIAASPTVSALRQQRLADYLAAEIRGGGRARLEKLLPRHPRDTEAYRALSEIYSVCHAQIVGVGHPKLHLRMAAISLSWMRGDPLPQIIDKNHTYLQGKLSSTIRKTLSDIEQDVRFKYLRLTTCYLAVLEHLLRGSEHQEYLGALVPLPTYLEVGASDQSMISFMSLGVSRLTARMLTENLADKEISPAAALGWLRGLNLAELEVSPIVRRDIERALTSATS